jgi:folate-binding protein YgfZ
MVDDYQAALTGLVFYRTPGAGYLRIQGADRLAFLQRQTTNDVTLLSPGRSILTVLTNPAARILDVLWLISETVGQIGALTLPGHANETTRFLKSRIFFKDQVELIDASHEITQLELGGPAAPDFLAALGISGSPQPEGIVNVVSDGITIRCLEQPVFTWMRYRLLVPISGRDSLEAALISHGAARLSDASYHILRIENGLPAAEFELTSDYTPLETGLDSAISTTKGCYTGQEVIARQITYDKVTQRLVLLRLQAPGQAGERLWAEGRPVGLLTSAAKSPRFGPLALAVVKKPYHQPGTSVIIGGDGKAGGIPAEVTGLPLI